jgi:hypothetical protein
VRGAAAWISVQATRVTSSSPLYIVAKICRENVDSDEQSFVDAFNTQRLPLSPSG